MDILILGGTQFLGRALISAALQRDYRVTVLNRGSKTTDGVEQLTADRTDQAALQEVLSGRRWNLVVDTWSQAPKIATATAKLLQDKIDQFCYISSASVYRWGEHENESSPLVDGDAQAGADEQYPQLKRGAELGVLQSFPNAILARAGLILGPHEDIGRLPWWLRRISEGGQVVAPGQPARPLQYIDARDLAYWVYTAAENKVTGPVDLVGPSGFATMGELLQTCIEVTKSNAELVWFTEQELETAGAQPWTHLPCWVPPTGDFAGFLENDVTQAMRTGLKIRPIRETVEDTWHWLQNEGYPTQRADRATHGLPKDIETKLLSLR